jgi:hypothetical protein
VPQAWAAGSIFHFVRAILGINADAPNNRLAIDPYLPDWLPDVTLRDLKVGGSSVDLRFWREANQTRWEVLAQQGNVTVEQKPWQPWQIPTPLKRATT